MQGKLSATLLQLGYRALNVVVIGTIGCVTVLAESVQHTFPDWIIVPLILSSAAGVVIFIPLLAVGFAHEFGSPIFSLLLSKKPTFESKELTKRGEELAKQLGLKAKIKFRVRPGIDNAYSTVLGNNVVIGESFTKSQGECDATTGHELVHLSRHNYRNKMLRLALYALFAVPFLWRESWLNPVILLPYTFALLVYPMKYAFYWGEYNADEGGAVLTSPEDMIATLLHIKESHGDHNSFTHPSPSKRIRQLQKKFGQAH